MANRAINGGNLGLVARPEGWYVAMNDRYLRRITKAKSATQMRPSRDYLANLKSPMGDGNPTIGNHTAKGAQHG